MGFKYGGDVRITLEKMVIYQMPVPKDPVKEDNHEDDTETDEKGKTIITKKARDKITYSEKKIFDMEIAEYAHRKRILARNLDIERGDWQGTSRWRTLWSKLNHQADSACHRCHVT